MSVLSTKNSTTVPVKANGIFEGEYENITQYSVAVITVYADTLSQLTVYQSQLGTVPASYVQHQIPASERMTFNVQVAYPYLYLTLDNLDGAVDQTLLNLCTIYRNTSVFDVSGSGEDPTDINIASVTPGTVFECSIPGQTHVIVDNSVSVTVTNPITDVSVSNFPALYDVSVQNWPASLNLTVTNPQADVSISNFPSLYDVSIQNWPASLNVNVTNPQVDISITNFPSVVDMYLVNWPPYINANILNNITDISVNNFPSSMDVNITNVSVDVSLVNWPAYINANILNNITDISVNNFPSSMDVNITNVSVDVSVAALSNTGAGTIFNGSVTRNSVGSSLHLVPPVGGLSFYGTCTTDVSCRLQVMMSNNDISFYGSQYIYTIDNSGDVGWNLAGTGASYVSLKLLDADASLFCMGEYRA